MRSTLSKGDKAFGIVMQAGALAVAAFWLEFYSKGRVRTSDRDGYMEFQRAFLAADGYLAVALWVGGAKLKRRSPQAVPVGIAAGSGLVFLGLMDTLYNLQHGKYSERTPEMAIEAAINALCLVCGPYTMVRMWRARQRLQG